LPETVVLVSVIEEPSPPKMPPPLALARLPRTVALVSTSASASPTRMPPPRPAMPSRMTSPLRVAAMELRSSPSLMRNSRLVALVTSNAESASMPMSASPSPSMSPSMVMPSVVIASSPFCRNSTPAASEGSNLIVSGSASPLALASPSASRSERPLPSGAPLVSLPSNVSSASVVTVNSAMTSPPWRGIGS
jgi:hypothetical protein